MIGPIASVIATVRSLVRTVDGLAAAGSIGNARLAARETALQLAARDAVPGMPESYLELTARTA